MRPVSTVSPFFPLTSFKDYKKYIFINVSVSVSSTGNFGHYSWCQMTCPNMDSRKSNNIDKLSLKSTSALCWKLLKHSRNIMYDVLYMPYIVNGEFSVKAVYLKRIIFSLSPTLWSNVHNLAPDTSLYSHLPHRHVPPCFDCACCGSLPVSQAASSTLFQVSTVCPNLLSH